MNAGTLLVDFAPDHHIDDLKSVLIKHKNQFAVLLFSNHFNSMKFSVFSFCLPEGDFEIIFYFIFHNQIYVLFDFFNNLLTLHLFSSHAETKVAQLLSNGAWPCQEILEVYTRP